MRNLLKYGMSSAVLILGSGLLLGGASPAEASTVSLDAVATAGPCGGSIPCTFEDNKTASSGPLAADMDQTLGGHAVAHAVTNFGTQKVYAEAFSPVGNLDAQARGFSRVQDFIPASNINGSSYTFHFNIKGTQTDTSGTVGDISDATLNLSVVDDTTNFSIGDFNWDSAFKPTGNYDFTASVIAGHAIRFTVTLQASAFSTATAFGDINGPATIVADYSHSLNYFITSGTPGGPDLIGGSGHNYSIAPTTTPLPATALLLASGLGLMGGLGFAQRRRAGIGDERQAC